jgi:hypothetical protein
MFTRPGIFAPKKAAEAYFIDPALLAAAAETRDAVAGATGAFAAPSDPDELPGWVERDP